MPSPSILQRSRSTPADIVLLNNLESLFLKAIQNNVSIIARTPLAFGFLSGQVEIDKLKEGDHRLKWPKEQLELWGKSARLFSTIAKKNNMTSSELAIKFCVSFDAVASVIPGMLTSDEAIQNSKISNFVLSEDDIEEIINLSKSNNLYRIQITK